MATVGQIRDEPGQPPALEALSLAQEAQEQVVTPFDVSGGVDEHGKAKAIDYEKLIVKFGSQRIDQQLLDRFEKATGRRPHRLLRRGMVFSHRDLNQLLDAHEKGLPFFLYTGRGPSSDSMHVGHAIPFEFTKYLQDVFKVPLVIMLTDDEKFFHSPKLTLEETHRFALQNAMDIIAIGFDMEKTFIFIDTDFVDGASSAGFNKNVRRLGKRTTNNQIKGTFGFTDTNNIAEFAFPAMQSAPAFATSFPFIFGYDEKRVAKIPCLIPCAIDQDPYFRQCRDNAKELKYHKPALIHSVFLPSLKGSESKMSASDSESSVYLSDTNKQIQKKVGKAFSGGQDTRELHKQLGGRTAVDVPYQYLTFFLEDDEKLQSLHDRYEAGELETGEMKSVCTEVLQAYVSEFRERRAKVTEAILNEFTRPRQLVFRGMPSIEIQEAQRDKRIKGLETELAREKATKAVLAKPLKRRDVYVSDLAGLNFRSVRPRRHHEFILKHHTVPALKQRYHKQFGRRRYPEHKPTQPVIGAMSARSIPTTSSANTVLDTALASPPPPVPLWDRLSTWASENRAAVYTIAGVAVIITGAGAVYYFSDSREGKSGVAEEKKKASKKERRKAKKEKEKEKNSSDNEILPPKAKDPESKPTPTVEPDPLEGLPQIDETTVETLSDQERKECATKLKVAGNKAYGDKRYNEAIDLYGKAIICQPDPIFYSNRAACYNALGDWDKVVEDTTAAIALNSEYVKALNRRANAYEHLERYSEALLDYTASCIIDGFRNEPSAQSVERLLKKVAEAKGKAILEGKEKKLPSSTFVTNYLQSFRPRPAPDGLEDSVELDDETGKGQLKAGLIAMRKKTSEGYEEASKAFDRALELDDLGDHEALAYNMRGTFRYLRGENSDALRDLSKSVELQPSLTQSFIKRASMHLELGNRKAAANDFDQAMEQKKDDPDIYYHRAQLHFILGEFAEAAKDYQKSIDLDKNFIFSHIQLGVTQYKMGSIASSMATFRKCIKNFDKVADVYNYYGELLLDQQKYQEAIEKFDTAVEMEMQSKPLSMNVLPLINKALALFQWKQDYQEAEKLCQKALIIDPECDIAVATMAQLLLQQGKVTEALKYFERAAELSRTEGEIVNALSYAEATRTQLEVTEKYPQLASRLHGMSGAGGLGGPGMR